MTRTDLSTSEARRIALAAQGFDRPRPRGRVDVRHLRRVIHQLGLLQIDYVNILLGNQNLISDALREESGTVGLGLHMEFHAGGQWIITSHVRAIAVEASATGAPC